MISGSLQQETGSLVQGPDAVRVYLCYKNRTFPIVRPIRINGATLGDCRNIVRVCQPHPLPARRVRNGSPQYLLSRTKYLFVYTSRTACAMLGLTS